MIMKCTISCSFGEIIDKITILQIKQKKATNIEQQKNITMELNALLEDTQQFIKFTMSDDVWFQDLFKINNKLWILEDLIRDKSQKKEFDEKYIEYAESIHVTNDERYQIKRKINEKYNSTMKEEKIYKQAQSKDLGDEEILKKGKDEYLKGDYKKSYEYLNGLIQKYKNVEKWNQFLIELYFSYFISEKIISGQSTVFSSIKRIMDDLETLDIIPELKEYCKYIYGTGCLEEKEYEKGYDYLNFYNSISGPNVTKYNMCFFKEGDENKTLLIYDGGGLGDKFMLCRFIPEVCKKYEKNEIIFFLDDSACWMFTQIFESISNLKIVSYSNSNLLPSFDYHINLILLLKYLDYRYDTIQFTPMLEKLEYPYSDLQKQIISELMGVHKPRYIINWRGNAKNGHELTNRRMELKNAIPLLKLTHIHWICITQDITKEEKEILDQYNVKCYGDKIDQMGKSFYDSVQIIRHTEGVISTDTSIAHLAANLNVQAYILLTIGCEWRWTRNTFTNWYPNEVLLRQKKYQDWGNVIEELVDIFNMM